ncbi:MAG: mechanosensitive ion channel family protein [Candidatus Promineifilaceae bacterium]|nr:mechanosensitive ion channel family protein [Candidatus Promineifilaceae bacterium]
MSSLLDELLALVAFDGSRLLLQLVQTLVLVLVLLAVRVVLRHLVNRRVEDPHRLYRWRKVSEYATLVVLVVGVALIWLVGAGSAATYLGLLSAGLAIALQDPIANLVGWLFIVWRRPFEVGDRIQIGEQAGDVVDTDLFLFTLVEIGNWVEADQSTGRVVHVPNRKVFSEPLANYSEGFDYIWHEIPVLITFESDWRRAKAILQQITEQHAPPVDEEVRQSLQRAARRHMIIYENLTPIVYTRVDESGTRLTMRYLVAPRRRRAAEERIWQAVLDAFAREERIEFAYPTRRLYYYQPEADPALPARAGPGGQPQVVDPPARGERDEWDD